MANRSSRRRRHGFTLVELTVSLVIGTIVMFGAIALVDGANSSLVRSQRVRSMAGEAEVVLQGLGNRVRCGVDAGGSRQFAIYATYAGFRAGDPTVADGTAGGCLFVPPPVAAG